MTRLAILLAMLAACSKDNPYYCDEQCQMMLDGGDGDSGGSNVCVTNIDCADEAGKPVCDTTGACVACTATDVGACAGTSPICVAAMNMCAPCEAHTECKTSDACLPTGACGTDAEVAYVATGGNDTNPCTKALPCATLSYAATLKPYVKLQNDIDEVVSLADVNVTVLADPGTSIRRTISNGAVVTVSGTSTVKLGNVIIRDGATSTGHGILVGAGDNGVNLTLENVQLINNTGNGLSIGGGTLTMSRCLLSQNTAGGAVITADFDITNSMFVVNGTGGSLRGGVELAPTAQSTFAFNTVADNDSSNATTRGINCTQPVTVSSTIVVGNLTNGCSFDYSMFDVTPPTLGVMNKMGVPHFLNTNAIAPLAADYYRIANNSDAIDSGAPTSTVMTDIDGESRPQNGVRDIGADEYK